jgi:hypothetical protein
MQNSVSRLTASRASAFDGSRLPWGGRPRSGFLALAVRVPCVELRNLANRSDHIQRQSPSERGGSVASFFALLQLIKRQERHGAPWPALPSMMILSVPPSTAPWSQDGGAGALLRKRSATVCSLQPHAACERAAQCSPGAPPPITITS